MSKPFKKFSANSDFETWFNGGGGDSLPNWVTLVTEDKGVHYSNSTHKTIPTSETVLVGTRVAKAETVAGDVYMYDTVKGTNFWMRPSIFTNDIGEEEFTAEQFTPIAVVAIPASHNVYGNGDVGMVSLNYMSITDPENGGDILNGENSIYYGGYEIHGYAEDWHDLSIPNLNTVPVYENSESVALTSSTYGFFASDLFDSNFLNNNDSPFTTGGYRSLNNRIPSPYTQDGGRNSDYYSRDITSTNCLSDFDGKGNTEVMINIVNENEIEWNETPIATKYPYSYNYFPAACCCQRYHKGNTNAGEWYLPAAGEMGYVCAKLNKINQAITDTTKMGYSNIYIIQYGFSDEFETSLWTSSEASDDEVVLIYLSNNDYMILAHGGKKYNQYKVRAFLRA